MHKLGVLIATAALPLAVAASAQADNYNPDNAAYGKYYAKYYQCPARWYGPVLHKDKSKDGWGVYCYQTKPAKGKRFKAGVNVKPAKYVGGAGYYYYKGKKYQKYNANRDYKAKYYYYPYK